MLLTKKVGRAASGRRAAVGGLRSASAAPQKRPAAKRRRSRQSQCRRARAGGGRLLPVAVAVARIGLRQLPTAPIRNQAYVPCLQKYPERGHRQPEGSTAAAKKAAVRVRFQTLRGAFSPYQKQQRRRGCARPLPHRRPKCPRGQRTPHRRRDRRRRKRSFHRLRHHRPLSHNRRHQSRFHRCHHLQHHSPPLHSGWPCGYCCRRHWRGIASLP